MRFRIFLSSTGVDFRMLRRKLDAALRRMDQFVIQMESAGGMDATPTGLSLSWARECDILIGIYGHRYGTISPDDPQGRSITELEYEEAKRFGKRRLCYFDGRDPASTASSESAAARENLQRFKDGISRDLVRATFSGFNDLVFKIGSDLGRIVAGEPIGFDRMETAERLRANASTHALKLRQFLLEGRDCTVESPLSGYWREFVSLSSWRAQVQDAVWTLRGETAQIPALTPILDAADKIHPEAPIPRVLAALHTFDKSRPIEHVRRYEEERRSRHAHEDDGLRKIRRCVWELQKLGRDPEFKTVFLVTSSLGVGKTHFLCGVLEDETGAVVLPLRNRHKAPIEALIVAAAREALNQLPGDNGGLRTTRELINLLSDPSDDDFAQQYRLVFAFDQVEDWLCADDRFLDHLQTTIEDLGSTTNVAWLLLLGHREFGRVLGRTEFFDKWGFLGRRQRNWRTDRENKLEIPNIGGWIDLDSLTEDAETGVAIVRDEFASDSAPDVEVRTLLADSTTRTALTVPFVAWTFVDLLRNSDHWEVDLRFVTFVRAFWLKRREALVRSLARHVSNGERLLDNVVRAISAYLLRTAIVEPTRQSLRDALYAIPAIAGEGRLAIESALSDLIAAGLLRSHEVMASGYEDEAIRIGLPVFWEYNLAERLLVECHERSDADAIVTHVEGGLTGLPDQSLREGALSFFLLLLDAGYGEEHAADDARPQTPRFAAAIWARVVRSRRLPSSAVWFAGARASASVQRTLLDHADEDDASPDMRSLLALMYFANRADPDAIDAPRRLRLLQPHFVRIGRFGLGEYYRHVAEIQLERSADAEDIARCMLAICGCEPTGAAESLGRRCAALLIKSAAGNFDDAFAAMSRFLTLCATGNERVAARFEYFPEFVVAEFCEWLIRHLDLRAFAFLYYNDWYAPDSLGCETPVSIWMEREANIALGHVFQRRRGRHRDQYAAIVEKLAESQSPHDLSIAFFLIKHSVPTYGERDPRPHPRFDEVLAALVANPLMDRNHLRRHESMLVAIPAVRRVYQRRFVAPTRERVQPRNHRRRAKPDSPGPIQGPGMRRRR